MRITEYEDILKTILEGVCDPMSISWQMEFSPINYETIIYMRIKNRCSRFIIPFSDIYGAKSLSSVTTYIVNKALELYKESGCTNNHIDYNMMYSSGRYAGASYFNTRFGEKKLDIKRVIFNDPATIVYWEDGTKTVVKCQEGDTFDKEKGLAMAISKKVMGTNKSHSDFNYIFDKWIKEE